MYNTLGHYDKTAVARTLGVKYQCFLHMVEAGFMPPPQHAWKRRKYYLPKEVEALKLRLEQLRLGGPDDE
jgi:hypothetical protein